MPWWKRKQSSDGSGSKWAEVADDLVTEMMSKMHVSDSHSPSPPAGPSMPQPQLWNPASGVNDLRPQLPSYPPSWSSTQLPPRVRPPHLADRPNPYDLPVPPPFPQQPYYYTQGYPYPINPQIPASTPSLQPGWPSQYDPRPPISGSYSDPPPALRPGFSPAPTPSYPYSQIDAGYQQPQPPPIATVPPPNTDNSGNATPTKPSESLLAAPEKRPGHVRRSSEPPVPVSAISSEDGVQCSGITKSGKRCTRMVKNPHPLAIATTTDDGEIERYCHQHVKDVLSSSGFYYLNDSKHWIEFDDWIPTYLTSDTMASLRTEMSKPPSSSDVPGYIYAYEIRDPKTPKLVKLKVGRAVKLAKRLDEWSKQCGSKEVILRGWFPGNIVDDESAGPSLLRGKIVEGDPELYCHRLERLIHLELSDLMLNKSYMTTDYVSHWDANSAQPRAETPPGSKPKKLPKAEKCPDCGKFHKEIFSYTRVMSGELKNHEWDGIVLPVIERWGRYVREVMKQAA